MTYSNKELDYLQLLTAEQQRFTTEVKSYFGGDFVSMMEMHGMKPCKCKSKIYYLRVAIFKNGTEHAEARCAQCDRHHSYVSFKEPEEVELGFGKHKGKTINAIMHEDPQYIGWLSDKIRGKGFKVGGVLEMAIYWAEEKLLEKGIL